MKIKLTIALIIVVAIGCNQINDKSNDMTETTRLQDDFNSTEDFTPKVTGIGGIFFFLKHLIMVSLSTLWMEKEIKLNCGSLLIVFLLPWV